ncbi:MAG: DsrE family protein [Stenotrophobium sp.]
MKTETEMRDLVVVITHGIDHELSSAGLIIALGGMTAGLKVFVFCTSSGVDILRRGAAGMTHIKPMEPLADMLRDFHARGGTLWACAPCVKARGYTQDDLIDSVIITGASVMHALIRHGAATLSF